MFSNWISKKNECETENRGNEAIAGEGIYLINQWNIIIDVVIQYLIEYAAATNGRDLPSEYS